MKAALFTAALRRYVILSRIISWLVAATAVATLIAWYLKDHYLEDFVFATLLALSGFLYLLNRRKSLGRVAEHFARESEANLRTTLESLIEGCQIIDFDWRYVYLNSAAARHGRKSIDELAGRKMTEVYPEIESTAMFEVLKRSMERREPAAMENDFVAPDGSVGCFQLVIQPVPQGLFILSMDITERRRAEASSRDAEALFKIFMEASPTLQWVKDEEGRYQYVNRAWLETSGFAPEQVIGKNLFELVPRETAEEIAGQERDVMQRDRAVEIKQETSFRNERRFWNSIYFPFRNPSGKRFIGGISVDITEEKRAQDDLRETSRRNREMLANLNLIAMMLDRNGTITFCNDYLLKLTDRAREEVMGRNWFDLFVPEGIAQEIRHAFSRLLDDDRSVWHHEDEILTKSGRKLLIRWNHSILRSPEGAAIGTASIGEDITDRKRLERQIVRAQRLDSLGSLAGGIAHDLNNLLMPILIGVTLLRKFNQDERSLKAVDNIELSARKGSDLVKQILLFTKGGEISFRTVHLRDIVREVLAIVTGTFPPTIQVEVAIANDLRPVPGDPTQLSQVLLNLTVNARDAMPDGGRICISASDVIDPPAPDGMASGPYVLLEVSDTGHGIPKEIIDEIFDPFFTTKDIGKGTGLGLSTVQGIIRNHRGFLTVSSAPGEGSSFKIYFPAHPVEPAERNADKDLAHPPAGQGEVILIVDDDASVLAIAEQTLEAFGYIPLTAEDGARAIGIFSRRHAEIAAVVTDMVLPVMDGMALIAGMKDIDPDVRVVATSGSPDNGATLAKAGVNQVLTKPFTADALLRAVAQALAQPAKDA